jgi:hypothetical protein
VADGTTNRFLVPYSPLVGVYLAINVDGDDVSADVEVEEATGYIVFDETPAAESVVIVAGNYFKYFTETEVSQYISDAFEQHAAFHTDPYGRTMTIATLPTVEEYPVIIYASTLAMYTLATDASFDIDIQAPDGVMIPRSERFRQLSQIIQQRMEQYKQLSSALNIGLWRIEMGTLRRVSRMTNKLVPIFMPQEVIDSRKPERVFIQNDLKGRDPAPSYAGVYDISLYQGDSWSGEFDFPFNVTDLDFKAQIRTFPNAPALYATFDIAKFDAANGRIRLTLSPSATAYLPARAFWDLQATNANDPTFEQTYVRGQVFVTQQVTVG